MSRRGRTKINNEKYEKVIVDHKKLIHYFRPDGPGPETN